MKNSNSSVENLNVSATLGKLQDYSGKQVKNDTGKDVVEPIVRTILPAGEWTVTPTGYGLIVETKSGKLLYLVQFESPQHGHVMLNRSEADFNLLTNSKGTSHKAVCGDPQLVNGVRYTTLNELVKS